MVALTAGAAAKFAGFQSLPSYMFSAKELKMWKSLTIAVCIQKDKLEKELEMKSL